MYGMQWRDLRGSCFADFHFGVSLNPKVRSEHECSTFPRGELFASPLSVLHVTYSIEGNNRND